LFQQINDQPGLARTLLNLGNTARAMGQIQVALEYYTKARGHAEEAKSDPLLVGAVLAIADLYTSQHDYAVALSYVERIKPIDADALTLKRRAASVDPRLGNLYFRLGKPEAREVLERARAENHEVKDFLEEAWIVERLAELDEPTKPQEALQRYRDAAEIYGRVGDVTQESSSLAFMARLYSRLKEPALAAAESRLAEIHRRRAG
jgi:tetratricopeptide (TPR) repeat protein